MIKMLNYIIKISKKNTKLYLKQWFTCLSFQKKLLLSNLSNDYLMIKQGIIYKSENNLNELVLNLKVTKKFEQKKLSLLSIIKRIIYFVGLLNQ